MNKLLTTTIALGAILTLEMNQPLSAHRGGGGGRGHGGYHGGHGGYHGGHGGYNRGYGRGYGYGVGGIGVGIGLGALGGAAIYNNRGSYYGGGGYYGGTTYSNCGYDSYGRYICYTY